MKHIALYLGLATALVASCSIQEEDFKTPQQEDDVVFYASFEQPADEGTRVYANENLLLRWTADDRVSIFNKNTYNQQYKFLGETGDNSGGFSKADGADFVTGNPLSHVVSVYPYQESTKITEEEVVTLNLPAEQHYAESTFGLGANTMVAMSSDNDLQFKNVCGYLRISLFGEGIYVSSITLKGNNGEKLAGMASMMMSAEGLPTVTMNSDASDEIVITCETPVLLGSNAEESTSFWFVVPPVTFSKGFHITVSGTGGSYEMITEKTVTIERSNLSKMSPIEVDLSLPKNIIYYTSSDGTVVTPNDPDAFGATILSNEYIDGLGIITFDRDVTRIGSIVFARCSTLTSMALPESVTSIANEAFFACESLSAIAIPKSVKSIDLRAFAGCGLVSITIPKSVISIGDFAFGACMSLEEVTFEEGLVSIGRGTFDSCRSLTSIVIPKSVNSVGDEAFNGCWNLSSLIIQDGVSHIGRSAFSVCRSLESVIIPKSITVISESTFNSCTSLVRVSIPDGVTDIDCAAFSNCPLDSIYIPKSVSRIGDSAFSGCTNLSNVTISEGVMSIGPWAFANCTSLRSIDIPDSITSIGEAAFLDCTSLSSFTGKYARVNGSLLILSGRVVSVAMSSIIGDFGIPEDVTDIGDYSFAHCERLASISLPNGLTRIGDHAFVRCSSLTHITIPDSVTSIGKSAFLECEGLTSISIPKNVSIIEDYSFDGCTNLSNITISEGVTSINTRAFALCTALTSITIPESVTSIGYRAFFWCTSLTSITLLPKTPPICGGSMFYYTHYSALIYVPSGSVEAYKTAEYWSDYADRIQAILE